MSAKKRHMSLSLACIVTEYALTRLSSIRKVASEQQCKHSISMMYNTTFLCTCSANMNRRRIIYRKERTPKALQSDPAPKQYANSAHSPNCKSKL